MFDTLKLYTRKQISLTETLKSLGRLGYHRVDDVSEEGDFSVKGDLVEVYPANFTFPVRLEWDFDCVDKIYSYDKALFRKLADYDLLILIPFTRKRKKKYSEDIPLDIVLKVKKGDYVVHSRYGIGRLKGSKKMTVRGKEDYFFEIEYAQGDKLYIPKEEAHLVQKYASFSAKPPKLSRLGTKEWARTKEKAQASIRKYALELLRIQAQRKLIGGIAFSSDNEWQDRFEASFPYKETEDQAKAWKEVKADMEASSCMDRLICGDVGYGKTEVAMRAVFKAAADGKQVAFLVPTTILAFQHYKNFKDRVRDFPLEVEMLSRFRTPARQKEIISRLKKGTIDVLIGTHRMVSKDVEFKDLGLLIIDEEQKFGVMAKEKIKKMKIGIDVLTLTATPIPRTLYMGLVGLKNISLIKTPPKDRLAVKTRLADFSPQLLGEVIKKEKKRKGQVFFIHNRIESLFKIERTLRKVLPENISLSAVHGRMPSRYIEKVMFDFIEGKIDCLLCTAIVESGIDIPSANTIIVNDANMFGLSDLHQLRGRVGRFDVQAYAYFLVRKLDFLPEDSRRRLELLQEFSHLGAGFEIAMSDLEMRGAGNLLGPQQHGFIWMIGFDLYCRMFKKEIEYLKDTFKIEEGA